MRNSIFGIMAVVFLAAGCVTTWAPKEAALPDYTKCQSRAESGWNITLATYYCGKSDTVDVFARNDGSGVIGITWYQVIEWDENDDALKTTVRHYCVENGVVTPYGQHEIDWKKLEEKRNKDCYMPHSTCK